MAYVKQTFIDIVVDSDGNVTQEGTLLKSEHLNHIEDGIVENEKAIGNLSEDKVDKTYVVELLEELKELILSGNTSGAIALLDQAILDQAVLY